MHQWNRKVGALGAIALAAALVTACGGGGSDTETQVEITSVKVMGDSLADVGTFGGVIATVQGGVMYPQRVAENFGVTKPCNYYVATGATTFVPNPAAGCTNYAIGGGRINNFTNPASPLSVIQQLKDASATANFGARELVLIDGGGNDAADLVGAYLRAATDSGATYGALLKTELDATVVDTQMATGAAGLANLGGLYMTALANQFSDAIDANVLQKGGQYVAVLNMPPITHTPRFQTVLNAIAAANGANGVAARAQAEALFKGWISAYNSRLAARFAGNSKVAVVDFYTSFEDNIANPTQYSLTNVTTPACPATGVGSDGLPTYTFATCTADALSAAPPTGVTDPNWWRSYAFSDGFYPTPYAHQLVSQLIARSLASKGWL